MFGVRRQKSEEDQPSANAINSMPPWQGAGLIAQPMQIAVGRRGKTVPGVLLSANGVEAPMRADDLRDFAAGRLDIIESVGQDAPVSFLARTSGISPNSAAGEQVQGLPKESVVFLPPPMTSPPTEVLVGATLAGFILWAGQLPR